MSSNISGASANNGDSQFDRDAQLLVKINQISSQLGTVVTHIELPEIPENLRSVFRNANVLMVDDSNRQIVKWSSWLIAATEGNFDYVRHYSQSAELLTDQIVSKNPKLILLDYELSCGLTGVDLVKTLKNKLPNCALIGFSSEASYNARLIKAGVDGAADKGSYDPLLELQKISDIYSNCLRSSTKLSQPTLSASTLPKAPEPELQLSLEQTELMVSMSLLCQCYIISHASISERIEMGLPAEIAESMSSNLKNIETLNNPTWWMEPFNGKTEAILSLIIDPNRPKGCETALEFFKELINRSSAKISLETVKKVNDEITKLLESAR